MRLAPCADTAPGVINGAPTGFGARWPIAATGRLIENPVRLIEFSVTATGFPVRLMVFSVAATVSAVGGGEPAGRSGRTRSAPAEPLRWPGRLLGHLTGRAVPVGLFFVVLVVVPDGLVAEDVFRVVESGLVGGAQPVGAAQDWGFAEEVDDFGRGDYIGTFWPS